MKLKVKNRIVQLFILLIFFPVFSLNAKEYDEKDVFLCLDDREMPCDEKGYPITGTIRYYHSNGKLSAEENYKDGKKDGIIKSYDENGKLNAEGNYKDGKKDGLFKYYEKGNLISEISFENDTILSAYFLKNNGKKRILTDTELSRLNLRQNF